MKSKQGMKSPKQTSFNKRVVMAKDVLWDLRDFSFSRARESLQVGDFGSTKAQEDKQLRSNWAVLHQNLGLMYCWLWRLLKGFWYINQGREPVNGLKKKRCSVLFYYLESLRGSENKMALGNPVALISFLAFLSWKRLLQPSRVLRMHTNSIA